MLCHKIKYYAIAFGKPNVGINCFVGILFFLILFSGCNKIDNIGKADKFVKFYNGQGLGADVKQTADRGYVIIGNVATENRGTDICLIRTDQYGNRSGDITYYGGNRNDSCYSLQITPDGGYIIAGSTDTVVNNSLTTRIFIIKTNATGTVEWEKSFGFSPNDAAYFVQLNGAQGYLVTGYTSGYGGKDAFLLSLDLNGNVNWMRSYGGGSNDIAKCIQVTSDGYILIGNTQISASSNTNVFIIKTNNIGLISQTAKFGGADNVTGEYVQVLPDGDYLCLATRLTSENPYSDINLFKLDKNLAIMWSQDIGGTDGNEKAKSVQLTSDSNFVIGGTHQVSDVISNFYLVKTDNSGNPVFSSFYGEESFLTASNLIQTIDNGFVMVGTNNIQGYDVLTMIKTGPDGKL
jgi:hypothetical protein